MSTLRGVPSAFDYYSSDQQKHVFCRNQRFYFIFGRTLLWPCPKPL